MTPSNTPALGRVQLAIRPSASLAAFLFLGYGLALSVIGLVGASAAWRMVLIAAVLCSGFCQIYKARKPQVIALMLGRDQAICLCLASGEEVLGKLLDQTLVVRWLIVLSIKVDGKSFPVQLTLPKDALGADGHRLLRRWLRWQCQRRKS